MVQWLRICLVMQATGFPSLAGELISHVQRDNQAAHHNYRVPNSRSVVSDFFATLWTVACQASPSMGLSRHEYWSELPLPSPMHKSEKGKWSHSCPTLSDPMDCSLPGFSIHGILQARVVEWGAIAFSVSAWKLNQCGTKKNELGLWSRS